MIRVLCLFYTFVWIIQYVHRKTTPTVKRALQIGYTEAGFSRQNRLWDLSGPWIFIESTQTSVRQECPSKHRGGLERLLGELGNRGSRWRDIVWGGQAIVTGHQNWIATNSNGLRQLSRAARTSATVYSRLHASVSVKTYAYTWSSGSTNGLVMEEKWSIIRLVALQS